jgi:drug/metabolite transporter (DMT)-like permease
MPGLAVVLGLLVALTYGSGDFLGGIASKRNTPIVVVAVSQSFGLVLMALMVVADRGAEPIGADLLAGAGAGSVGLIGVVLLYRGLAGGAMGVIAPITAVGAAIVPFTWGVVTGDRPSVPALVGVAVALLAVVLVSSSDEASERRTSRQDLLLAVGAGTAFGVVFLLLGITSEDSGMWPVLAARIASVSIVMTIVVVGRRGLRVAPGTRSSIIGAGVFDAGANALYLLAAREGLLSLVSVLSSLYPAATVVLARLFLREGMHRKQLVGIGLALGGVALIAAG